MKFVSSILGGAVIAAVGGWAVWNFTAGSDSCSYTPKEASPQLGRSATAASSGPVLVELFTSEGCSSCPPADRQLAFMQENQKQFGAEIVTLAFHVDYWDRLGWKDRFSSPEFSKRQNSYAIAKSLESSYTPQMIVDGGAQFVGSDGRRADKAVAEAANAPKGIVKLELDGEMVRVSVNGLPQHDTARVMFAVAEDRLETDVRAGENSGRKLSHAAVVRRLKDIAGVPPESLEIATSVTPDLQSDWKIENLRYVVFLQEERSKKVIAVGSIPAR